MWHFLLERTFAFFNWSSHPHPLLLELLTLLFAISLWLQSHYPNSNTGKWNTGIWSDLEKHIKAIYGQRSRFRFWKQQLVRFISLVGFGSSVASVQQISVGSAAAVEHMINAVLAKVFRRDVMLMCQFLCQSTYQGASSRWDFSGVSPSSKV